MGVAGEAEAEKGIERATIAADTYEAHPDM
jgi:hypothetical protein